LVNFDVFEGEFIETSIDFSPVTLSTSGGAFDYVTPDYVDGIYITEGVYNNFGFGTSSIHD
jgi:hypothetical protein